MPSRDNKARGGVAVSPGGVAPAAAPRQPAATGRQASATGRQASETGQPGAAAGQPAAPPKRSRLSLKNWRVRSRLLLLVTIPTLTALVLGGARIFTSVQGALTYQRTEQLANLSAAVTGLAGKLQDERDWTAVYIGDGPAGRAGALAGHQAAAAAQLQLVTEQYNFTAPWIHRVRRQLAGIGSGYPTQVQQDASAIRSLLAGLHDLRLTAVSTHTSALIVISNYTKAIDSLLAIDNDIALDSGDPVLASNVRALGIVSRIGEEASAQRALLAYAITQQQFGPGVLPALTTAQAQMTDNSAEFANSVTSQQAALYKNTVDGSVVDLANQYEQKVMAFGSSGKSLSGSGITSDEWLGAMSGKISAIRKVEQTLVRASISRASQLRRSAILDSAITGAAVVIVLGLALLLTTVVGRSMVRPLRRLRAGALEVAGLQLPETVRRMSESDGSGVPLTVAPIDVDSADEIGEVARAFDQVHSEALRLAANEAALRGNVNAMFVNLSRRSQSLVERQIRLIDDLEQGEQDAERLGSLFQMDHLATRMRRNSENLLVLAGHDSSRRWNQPVALVDVLRAAVSEIEQYERVSLNVQPGISVRGHAVNDAVHLLAELAENATSFSSAETPVTISGHLLSSGGVLLDITDQGVGMGAEEMAHANWRLDNPPVVDVAVSRRMGLFVVARLAARHGIRVRLRPAASGGLTALVWLPDEVVSRDGGMSPVGSRMPESAADAAAMSIPGYPGAQGGGQETDERWATAQEVTAARAPKFASTEGGAGENGGGLGRRRVPGTGTDSPSAATRWPGSATGPLPAFRTSPQPAEDASDEIPPPPQPASERGTGPMPAVGGQAFGGWPDPFSTKPAGTDPAGTDLVGANPASADPFSAASPGAASPGAASPGAASPGAESPSAALPAAALPAAALPAAESPAAESPAAESPPAASLGAASLGAESLAAESPGAMSPGAASPSAGVSGAEPPSAGTSGNGQQLPKRRVDRNETAEGGHARTPSTDMFSPPAERASGGDLFAHVRQPGAEPTVSSWSSEPSSGPDQPAEPVAPAEPAELAGAGTGPGPVLSAPTGSDLSAPAVGETGVGRGSNGSGGFGWDASLAGDNVVLPRAEQTQEYRLPIFEAVESDWFRRGRSSVGWSPQEPESEPEKSNWTSPADEGWQAAAAVAAPSSSGVTPAGLPKRVPQANLVPGTAAADASAPTPVRSAAATRERFASFQRGVREGRAAVGGDSETGEDDGSP